MCYNAFRREREGYNKVRRLFRYVRNGIEGGNVKIMKKLVVYLCVFVLVLGLTACGSDNTAENSAGTDSQVEGTEKESALSAQGDGQVQIPKEDEYFATVDVATIKQAVVDVLGENYWPNTEMSPEFLADFGLTEDMYDAFLGEMPLLSANVDTLIVIQAKADQVEAVETVLNNYREKLVNDTMQYPTNVGKIQASRIATFGNFVCFVQLGADVTSIMESGEEAVIRHCQEQNELALEAIGKLAGF